MGKIAFVFAGQGAQYSGMGQSLSAFSPAAAQVLSKAEALRPGTQNQCFSGTQEELSITKNTQPCLYCVDLMAARALEEAGVSPDCIAGFSLGEIAAVSFSGILSDEEGFSLVCKRAQAMQEAAVENPGAMAAVLKLDNQQVEALCGEFSKVYPVNYNCPGQLVVAGEIKELDSFRERVAQAGGKAVPLAVSGGFHSPFMQSAAQVLREELKGMTLQPPRMTLYANYTGKPYGTNAAELLAAQVENPVRWQETVEAMAAAGVDTFVECGPGKTLCGLIKKTVKGARVMNVEDEASLKAAVEAVLG